MKEMRFYKDELYPVYFENDETYKDENDIILPKTLGTKYNKALKRFLNIKHLVDAYLTNKEARANNESNT